MYQFIHIPKACGVSLDKLIYTNTSCNLKYNGHILASDMVHLFAFVRNPYDRLVSAYFYLCSNGENETMLAFRHIISKYSSFKYFILNMERDGLMEFILHLRPMWTWVVNEDGVVITKIFKIEEPEKINAFLLENGADGWLESPHANTSEHEPYESYLDEEIIAEINRIYAKDFELFNYTML